MHSPVSKSVEDRLNRFLSLRVNSPALSSPTSGSPRSGNVAVAPPSSRFVASPSAKANVSNPRDFEPSATPRSSSLISPRMSSPTRPLSPSSQYTFANSMSQQLVSSGVANDPDFEDYLISFKDIREGMLYEIRKKDMDERKRAAEQSHLSHKSESVIRAAWQRAMEEIWLRLRPDAHGRLWLHAIDKRIEESGIEKEKREFIRPPLTAAAQRHLGRRDLEFHEFLDLMRNRLKDFAGIPLAQVLRPSSPRRMAERDALRSQSSTFSYKPQIPVVSSRLSQRVRKFESHDQWLLHLSNEKKAWDSKTEALKHQLEAEEMSECTFKPKLPTASAEMTTTGVRSPTVSQRRTCEASSEDRAVAECTFKPERASANSYHLFKAGERKAAVNREYERSLANLTPPRRRLAAASVHSPTFDSTDRSYAQSYSSSPRAQTSFSFVGGYSKSPAASPGRSNQL